MFYGGELGRVQNIGYYDPVYIMSLAKSSEMGYEYALHDPLLSSLTDYIDGYKDIDLPIHVFISKGDHFQIVTTLNTIADNYFNGDRSKVYRLYNTTLDEQGIDVWFELRCASKLPSDDEARKYLEDLNNRLRKHFEQFPQFLQNPVRQQGQLGALRKPKFIPQFNITWQ